MVLVTDFNDFKEVQGVRGSMMMGVSSICKCYMSEMRA